MKTVDLRERDIRYLDDLVVVYNQHQTLQTTGKMLKLEVIVSPEQRDHIYSLLRNQAPYEPLPADKPVRWCGMTITTA